MDGNVYPVVSVDIRICKFFFTCNDLIIVLYSINGVVNMKTTACVSICVCLYDMLIVEAN